MAKFKDMQGFTKNLKPENPLITGNCAVEICDLGLSRNSVVAKLKVDMLLGFPSR
jgi:serine/threonine protein kinase